VLRQRVHFLIENIELYVEFLYLPFNALLELNPVRERIRSIAVCAVSNNKVANDAKDRERKDR
jgi:hypothetical protein